MAVEDGTDGPKRVQKILGEIFEFTLAHGQVKNLEAAGHSVQMTREKLESVCKACQLQTLGGGDEDMDVPGTVTGTGNEKRRLFLLRLISCKLSHLFDKAHNPNPMDRTYALGLDLYFRRIFSQDVYVRLNGEAKQILAAAGGDDVQVFNLVNTNVFFSTFVQNVLVRVIMSFRKYETAKDMLLQDINEALPHGYNNITHEQYRVLMSALLFDVFIKGKSEMDGRILDFRYGPKTAEILNQVSDRFGRDHG